MRDLTQQEIDNAPSWATHYVLNCDGVMFESLSKTQMMIKGQLTDLIPFGGVSVGAKPIPRKSFDIKPFIHWLDPSYDCDAGGEHCYFDAINKDKAIEIAKHFNLTADELK